MKSFRTRELVQIVAFVLTAALLSLLCAVLLMKLPIADGSPIYQIIFGMEAAGPTLAAILIMTFKKEKHSLRCFLVSKYATPFKFRFCVIAFLAPLFLYSAAKVISVIFIPQSSGFAIQLPSAEKLLIISWALVAEELGWRGFLQERVERLIGSFFTPLAVGLAFATWHFHFYLSGAMTVPFWALLLGCIFESYGYYLIVNKANGNVIVASLWHFSGNLFIYLLAISPDANDGSILPYVIAQCTFGLCFVVYLICRRHGTLSSVKSTPS